jgi:hypothetical protein
VIPNQDILNLLNAAIECSVFLSPTDPGLTYQELFEVGKRAEYLDGEVRDAAFRAGERVPRSDKLIPDKTTLHMWNFLEREEPELRNFDAFDFVFSELNIRVRTDGMANAQIARNILVERAISKGIPQRDIEAAITYQIMAGQLTDKNGFIRFSHNTGVRELPSETLAKLNLHRGAPRQKTVRIRALPIVKDIIERRTDGRPQSVEAFDAFAEQLDRLNYGHFRLWWKQSVAELRQLDPHSCPVAVAVLAAALIEGALTFVVEHARSRGLGVFRSKSFDSDPRTWKIDDLVASAASGSESAILDLQTKARAETLIRTRQRIHAGRMLSEYPAGLPDLRPEEARDAKATAEQVVRRILDWLQKFPPA